MFRGTLLFALSVMLLGCSLTLGSQETSLRVQLGSAGARFVSPDMASWSIEGTSLEGAVLPLTVFIQPTGTLQLVPGQWTFTLRVMDAGGAVVQTAQSAVTLVAGPNTAVFTLDPVIDVGIGWAPGNDPTWALIPTGSAESLPLWPTLSWPADLTLTAPAGFDSYVWLVNGEVQPEIGNVWAQESLEENWENQRLFNTTNVIQVLFSIDGKTYSLLVTVQMSAMG